MVVSGGKLSKVAHFDSKAEVEEYIREIGVPATFFMPGFYMANIPGQSLNNMQGAYNFALPVPTNSPIPLLDTEADTGKFVKGILLHREKVLGARIYGATDYYTPEQIIAGFQAVKPEAGKGGAAREVPAEMFKKILGSKGLPEPLQEELLQNMQLMPQFGYYGGASLEDSRSVRTISQCHRTLISLVLLRKAPHLCSEADQNHPDRWRASHHVERLCCQSSYLG